MDRWSIAVDRADIARAALADAPARGLEDGEAEFAVELAALTANNVTYAALGQPNGFLGKDAGYWDFYAPDRSGPGVVPVWGFATVSRSAHPDVREGEGYYGYWPLASHAVLRPERVGAVGFSDASEHRQKLPALYNSYQRIGALDGYRDEDRDRWPLYRPLQLTGWLVADQIADGEVAAQQVLVAGASSKTGLACAAALKGRDLEVIGLGSARSFAFLRDSGLYHRVLRYDEVEALDASVPTALVDFAGDAAVVRAVHAHFGAQLVFDLVVGLTHWRATGDTGDLPGAARTGFFAPSRLDKRGKDWGGERLRAAIAEGWAAFMPIARRLTAIDRRQGGEAALHAWDEAVAGRADPAKGVLLVP